MSDKLLNSLDCVAAREFRLLDASGRNRAIARVHEKTDTTHVAICDKNSRQRLVIQVEGDGRSALSFLDHNGQVIIGVEVGADGYPGISIWNTSGHIVLEADVGSDGKCSLVVLNSNGEAVFQAQAVQ